MGEKGTFENKSAATVRHLHPGAELVVGLGGGVLVFERLSTEGKKLTREK